MPELPEVETVRRGLLPVMEGQVIAHADIRRPDLRWPLPDRMADRLTGQRVIALRRRSKYILADLSSGETLIIHLGMSGRMLISGQMLGEFHHDHPAPEKHDHVVLDMAGGARITFNDARRFGAMDLAPTALVESHWLLANLGPEPLGNAFNEDYLVDRLKGRKTPIKSALLDQRIVSGLGNIYVCEVLFRTGLSPKRNAGPHRRSTASSACTGNPRCAVRGHRGWRFVIARLPPNRWRAWIFPACVQGLRSRGRPVRHPRLQRDYPQNCPVGAVVFLLPDLPKIA